MLFNAAVSRIPKEFDAPLLRAQLVNELENKMATLSVSDVSLESHFNAITIP